MNRRTFLATTSGTLFACAAGCLSDTDHEAELEAEIEQRSVELLAVAVQDGVVTVEYESDDREQDLAEVAMAFVERIDEGWRVERLEGLARTDEHWAWHAEAVWAREYLNGQTDAAEYGHLISDTLERTVIIGEGDLEEADDADANESVDDE